MGCNCKNKSNKPSKIEAPMIELQEAKVVAISTITEMENLLESINTNPQAKAKVAEFMRTTFGEVLSNYCDQVCKKRLKARLEKLKQEIDGK